MFQPFSLNPTAGHRVARARSEKKAHQKPLAKPFFTKKRIFSSTPVSKRAM